MRNDLTCDQILINIKVTNAGTLIDETFPVNSNRPTIGRKFVDGLNRSEPTLGKKVRLELLEAESVAVKKSGSVEASGSPTLLSCRLGFNPTERFSNKVSKDIGENRGLIAPELGLHLKGL